MIPYEDDIVTKGHPDVNWGLLIILFLLFVVQLMSVKNSPEFMQTWGLTPAKLFHEFGFQPLITVFTSMFIHGSWLHLLGNMWMLYLFGRTVEDRFGHLRYLLFYIVCGVVAGITQAMLGSMPDLPLIGASGAIAGVMGAYLMMFPGATIKTYIGFSYAGGATTVKLPAWFVTLVFIGVQCFFAFLEQSHDVLAELVTEVLGGGGVGYFAHIGGFVCGLALAKVLDQGGEDNQKPNLPEHDTKWNRVR